MSSWSNPCGEIQMPTPSWCLATTCRQPLQQVHQDWGPRVARIAARHEHVVQTRHAGEDLVPEFALAFNLGFVPCNPPA